MQEKFLNLSKGLRWVIVFLSWVLTIAGFVGCLLVKQYAELPWLEIILTMFGMLLAVIAICITIVQLTSDQTKASESEENV